MTTSSGTSAEGGWAVRFFAHGSNTLIVAMIGGLMFALAVCGQLRVRVPLVLLGIAIFGVVEYITHRFTLHAPPSSNAFVRRLQHRLHYDHHVAPERLDLLFIPPWFLMPVLCVYGAFYYFLTGSAYVVMALVLGNLLGLLHYERVHYIAHIPLTPSTAFGRYMKKYHLWHHFKNEHYWFGVTNPLGDFVFGTYRDAAEVDKSGSTRDLYGVSQEDSSGR